MQRKIQTKIEKEVSTAVYKGFKFTFTTQRLQGHVYSILVDGFNTRTIARISGSYDQNGELSIKFKGMIPDHEIAKVVFDELEAIKMESKKVG